MTKAKRRWAPFVKGSFSKDPIENARLMELTQTDDLYLNNLYQVNIRYLKGHELVACHLSIKRRDKGVIREWRDLQRIKNELCGVEREACEIFPAESRRVDTANQYHLWVLKRGLRFPFGYVERLMIGESGDGAIQEPFAED